MEPPVLPQSEAASHWATGNATQFSKHEAEDLLAQLSSLVTHPGHAHIGNVLAQMTDLERKHNSLIEETQHHENELKQKIADLEEMDKESRRKSLQDYTEFAQGLNNEKIRLSKDNQELMIEVKRHIKASEVAEHQLETRRRDVDALRKEMQQHEERADSANQRLQEVKKRLSDAQQSAKQFDETLKQRDLNESKLKEAEAAARSETQDLKKRNERLQKTFDRLKSYMIPASDVASADLTRELDEVWRASLHLVESAVAGNLPESTLKDKALWQHMEKLVPGLPLPHSDSSSAKSMRAVIILSVMAQAFVRYIFTPTYLLSEAGELDKVLALLAEHDSSHELFARSVLLGILAHNEIHMISSRVTGMVEDVFAHTQPIISPDRVDGFKSGLKNVAEKGAQTWSRFQRSKTHFKVTCEVDNDAGWGWNTLKLPVESAKALKDPLPLEPGDAVVTVFPQVLAVEATADVLISPGIVAAKSQFTEAEEELRLEKASLAAAVKQNSTRSRPRTREGSHAQGSTSGPTPNGFLGGR